jgi:ornithine carbamoyltransferase
MEQILGISHEHSANGERRWVTLREWFVSPAYQHKSQAGVLTRVKAIPSSAGRLRAILQRLLHTDPSMSPLLANGRLLPFDKMPARDVDSLLALARTLQGDAPSGQPRRALRGKNIGLLCEAQDSAEAALFHQAAAELGAHVSRIKPSLALLDTSAHVQHTARMLGRLYDALECQGMPAELVQQIERDAGVPVFAGLASANDSLQQLAGLLGGTAAGDDARRAVLQALLVSTLG